MLRDLDALEAGPFDLVVLGGGITGAGVALDASLRGLRVALIDKGDFASGTSSISSKLVHGGLRYLEHGQLGLVREALHERRRLLHNAPHLVWPLRFLIPFLGGSRVPAWKWRAGLLLYDLLAGPGNLAISRTRTRSWVRRRVPALRSGGLHGGAEYSDAQMDDARLCIEVIRSAVQHGAIVANHVEAIGFESAEGRIRAVRARDHLSGRELRIVAQVILNATGPWSDVVRRLAGEDEGPMLAPTRGVHLIAPDRGLPMAFLLLHPRDGRVFFVLPWLGKTLVGTTDTDCDGSPDHLTVTDADVRYLLEGYDHHFSPPLEPAHLLGQFVGVRPLARFRPGDPSDRSREDRLVPGRSGLLSVIGGKYTTYRRMAERITDEVMRQLGIRRPCRTRNHRLDGAPEGDWARYESDAVTGLCQRLGAELGVARHLVRRYGRRVGEVAALIQREPALGRRVVESEPDVVAELVYQRNHEMACLPEDFLLRRTRLGSFRRELLANPPEACFGSKSEGTGQQGR